MAILAIDFGEKHLGLALSPDNKINYPLKVINYQVNRDAIDQLRQICDEYQVTQIALGLPLRDGQTETQARTVKQFGKLLESSLKLKITYVDETLSSAQALDEMIKADVPKNKRKLLIHAFAAKLILDDISSSAGPSS